MALQRLLHEGQRCCLVTGPGDEALQHLDFLVDRSPEVDHLTHTIVSFLTEPPAG